MTGTSLSTKSLPRARASEQEVPLATFPCGEVTTILDCFLPPCLEWRSWPGAGLRKLRGIFILPIGAAILGEL